MSTVNMPASNSGLVGSNPTEATTIDQAEGVKKWKLFGPSTTVLRKWLSKFQKKPTPIPIYEEIISMSHKYLKVKIKSLAVEAAIIRKEENAAKARYRFLKGRQGSEKQYEEEVTTFWGLRNHRTVDVRDESRAAQLAYAFVRGKPFKYVEANTVVASYWSNPNNVPIVFNADLMALAARVARLATKYGKKDVTEDDIKAWYQADVTKEVVVGWQRANRAHEEKVRNKRNARRTLTAEEKQARKEFWLSKGDQQQAA